MRIVTEAPGEEQAIRGVAIKAFGTIEEAGIIDALRNDECWIPALSLVAKDDEGKIIGHALLTRASIGAFSSLSLAPVSVLPEYQNTGVGTALVKTALDTARALGEKTVTVLGHPTYYPRFGFELASKHGVTCTSTCGPDEAKMVISLDGSPIPAGEMGFGKPLADAAAAYRPDEAE